MGSNTVCAILINLFILVNYLLKMSRFFRAGSSESESEESEEEEIQRPKIAAPASRYFIFVLAVCFSMLLVCLLK